VGGFRGVAAADSLLQDPPRLAVVSVPYIEGTRALWFPICLGHELAHVRIFDARDTSRELPDCGSDVDEADAELAALLDQSQGSPQTAGVGRVEHIRSQFRSWTAKLACDLNAVRTFGPAGLSSITEFLSTLRLPTDDTRRWTRQQASATHPSLKTRVRVMARCLDRIGFRDDADYLAGAKLHAEATEGHTTQSANYLTSLIGIRAEQLIDHVLSWGEPLYVPSHYHVTRSVADQLVAGIPGRTHYTMKSGEVVRVSVADVVNGSWMARDQLTTSSNVVEDDADTSASSVIRTMWARVQGQGRP
jgi:hypothetical protein